MATPPSIYKYAERVTRLLNEANAEIDKLLLILLAQGDIINSQDEEINGPKTEKQTEDKCQPN